MKSMYWVLLIAFFIQCAGGAGSVEESGVGALQEVPGGIATSVPITEAPPSSMVFKDSAFSSYVQFSEDGRFTRYSYSFFPDGTDFNFENKTVSIPCSFLSLVPEGVDAQLSAPAQRRCEPYVINFDASESFTMHGIVTPLESEKFADLFEFSVTADGVVDATDGGLLNSSRGKFEDFYDLVLERRQQ